MTKKCTPQVIIQNTQKECISMIALGAAIESRGNGTLSNTACALSNLSAGKSPNERGAHEAKGGNEAVDAVVMACDKVAGLMCAGTLDKELAKAVKAGIEYRRKVWEHAGNFVL